MTVRRRRSSTTGRRWCRALVTTSLAALAVMPVVSSVDTAQAYVPAGVASAPPMGWNTWYNFNEQFNANDVRDVADALVSKGLAAQGYRDVGIDGGWWTVGGSPGRDASGAIVPNASFFAGTAFSSMKQLTDYIHGKGLLAGLYTDTGGSTGCGTARGSGGKEAADAKQFASWGFDYVKVDHCGGNVNGRTTAQSYAAWKAALEAAGRPMWLEICNWGEESPWTWGPDTGRSWRTGRDITFDNGHPDLPRSHIGWTDVTRNFSLNNHPEAARPGAVNDPDYLMIGGFGLTATEEQSYFGMWSVAAAPLVLSTDVRTVSTATTNIISNPEVIAVDQDSAVKQATQVSNNAGAQVWSRQLASAGTRAVLLLNDTAATQTISVDTAALGLSGTASVRDLYARSDVATGVSSYSRSLPAHGSVLLKVAGTESPYKSLRVVGTGLELNVSGGATADGAPVIQWSPGSSDNGRFQLAPLTGGYVKIVAKHSGKAVVVQNASTSAGAGIVQWSYSADSTTNDEWTVENLTGGQVRFKNHFSGLYLSQQGTAAGSQFSQQPWTDAAGQKFTLIG